MLETVVSLILIAVIVAAMVRDRREVLSLRKQLLELAKSHYAGKFTSELKIECDNSQALASLAEVQLAAERAAATLEKVAVGSVH